MKRTTNAQIGGKVFNLEEDAYQHIMQYLQRAKKELGSSEDCEDVLQDLEYAIRERLSNLDTKHEAVTLAEAVLIIDGMGKVESFEDGDKKNDESLWGRLKTAPTRSSQSAILGGVCSGISEAYDGGPTRTFTIRLFFIIIGFMSFGFAALLYLILWIIMPKDPLQSNDASANTIIERVRNYASEPKNKFEEKLITVQRVAHKILRFVALSIRVAVGAIASLALAVLVFGLIALLVWLYKSDTTQNLRELPVILHVVSVVVAIGAPLVAGLALVTKSNIARIRISAKSIFLVVIPWLSAVIASIFMFGANKPTYENYIKKIRPDNAFVSTITMKDKVVIKCIGFGTCNDSSYIYDVERCGITFKGITASYDDYMVYKPEGYWVRHDEWLVYDDEITYCKRVNEIQKLYGKDSVAVRVGSLRDPSRNSDHQTTWFQYNPFVYYERRDTL